MKIVKYLFVSFIVLLIISSSCTTQKELTYLNNIDTTDVQNFFEKERQIGRAHV